MHGPKEARETVRKNMIQMRRKLLLEEVASLSRCIIDKLYLLEPIINARCIMGFNSIGKEADLKPFMDWARKKGKTVVLPRVEDACNISAAKLESWEDMQAGKLGIMEPRGEAYPIDEIDVVLVPGLAFDYNGYRLGYGKGYYDRFLSRMKKRTFLCGIGYEFQVISDVHHCKWDVPVHWIVTDRSELVIDWGFF